MGPRGRVCSSREAADAQRSPSSQVRGSWIRSTRPSASTHPRSSNNLQRELICSSNTPRRRHGPSPSASPLVSARSTPRITHSLTCSNPTSILFSIGRGSRSSAAGRPQERRRLGLLPPRPLPPARLCATSPDLLLRPPAMPELRPFLIPSWPTALLSHGRALLPRPSSAHRMIIAPPLVLASAVANFCLPSPCPSSGPLLSPATATVVTPSPCAPGRCSPWPPLRPYATGELHPFHGLPCAKRALRPPSAALFTPPPSAATALPMAMSILCTRGPPSPLRACAARTPPHPALGVPELSRPNSQGEPQRVLLLPSIQQ